MTKKITMGVVTSTFLASTLIMSGCGDSGSSEAPAISSSSVSISSTSAANSSDTTTSSESSTSSTQSSSSSEDATSSTSSAASSSSEAASTATSVLISDAYVIGATVKMGGVEADIEVDGTPGMYEWTTATAGAFTVDIRATNDINGDGVADANDSYAPALSAPEGYSHINPFTTMKVNGVENGDLFSAYPTAFNLDPTFDFDVVAAGNSNLSLAKEVLTAALTLATEQKAAEDAAAAAPNFRVCEIPFLPVTGPNGENGLDSVTNEPCFAESNTDVSSSSSSSSTGSDFTNDIALAADLPALKTIAKQQFDLILGEYVVQ